MVELADTLVSGTSELTLMGVQVPLRARASDFEQCGTCNERVSAKFPAQKSRASPIKEKRV